ncbi:hypothetical protein BS47DRAFT_1263883, partial [Hydnum rufescens UP504]
RKHAQAHRWSSTVLPSLMRPFMAFKRQGVRPTTSTSTGCSPCSCPYVRTLQVVCVFMDYLQDITLAVCQCRPAATQLIQHGVFPCAPVWPSLAVSLDMLEFVAELFVHVAPNERAWAATLEKYLNVRGYQFAAKDSLRRRFANALSHYQMLVRLVDIEISKIVD